MMAKGFYDDDKILNDGELFIPHYSKHQLLFGRREQVVGGIGSKGGDFCFCKDEGQYETTKHFKSTREKGTHILYVNCRKSLFTMSKAQAGAVKWNKTNFDSLKRSDVVYLNRNFINKSNQPQKQTVIFSIEYKNMIRITASETLLHAHCMAQKAKNESKDDDNWDGQEKREHSIDFQMGVNEQLFLLPQVDDFSGEGGSMSESRKGSDKFGENFGSALKNIERKDRKDVRKRKFKPASCQ